MTDDVETPLFSVDASATPEQIAALVAVLSSLGNDEPAPPPRSEWAAPRRRLRTALPHGPDAWRAGSLP